MHKCLGVNFKSNVHMLMKSFDSMKIDFSTSLVKVLTCLCVRLGSNTPFCSLMKEPMTQYTTCIIKSIMQTFRMSI